MKGSRVTSVDHSQAGPKLFWAPMIELSESLISADGIVTYASPLPPKLVGGGR
jgi:hypothetical protein